MGPLSGIKVVEMGVFVAGPAAAAVLGDWGADVVKIENPAGGDPIRALVSLGYSAPDAERAVRSALDENGKGVGAAELIRTALARIGSRT